MCLSSPVRLCTKTGVHRFGYACVVIIDADTVSSERVYDRLVSMGFPESQCEDAALKHPLDFDLAVEFILRTSDPGGADAGYVFYMQPLRSPCPC